MTRISRPVGWPARPPEPGRWAQSFIPLGLDDNDGDLCCVAEEPPPSASGTRSENQFIGQSHESASPTLLELADPFQTRWTRMMESMPGVNSVRAITKQGVNSFIPSHHQARGQFIHSESSLSNASDLQVRSTVFGRKSARPARPTAEAAGMVG